MRKVLLMLIALVSLSAAAQTNEQLAERIKMNSDYLYGEGFGNTYNEASQNAITDLLGKIAVNVSSVYDQVINEVMTNGELDSKSVVKIIVNSYAQASLTNTESLIVKDSPDAYVLRYITKSELNKVFNQRKEKVMDMIRSAQRAEKKLKIDDALRYYYWSFLLLKSLQYSNEVTFDVNDEQRKLMVWLPEQINAVLDKLSVKVTMVDGNSAILYFTYDGEPIKSIDFSFYNGNSWTMLNSVKDGLAEIEVRPGVDVKSLKLRYEYEYMGETQIDGEIESVAKIFKGTFFRRSEISLLGDLKSESLKSAISKNAIKEQSANSKVAADIHLKAIEDSKPYAQQIAQIANAVTKQDFSSIRSLFTDDGWTMMDKLLHYGKAKMLGKQEYAFYDLGESRVVCRSLTMKFSFPNNNKTFTENVTFTFNAEKKIECVAFGLGAEAKTDIFDKGKRAGWSMQSMLAVTEFLENYKTAFALKRLDYIESVFDDNAVIVTGHVVKKPSPVLADGARQIYSSNEVVRYNRQTKNQYLKNIARCFNSNQFINIRFTDNDVCMMGKGGEMYGIQIHQDYYSSTYGDTGYLFLLVDINDPKQPTIKVRTWQPERDPNINNRLPRSDSHYGIIGPENF